MSYQIKECHLPHNVVVVAVVPSIEAAEKWLEPKGIVLFERDPDGHDAADCFTKDGTIYAIEKAGARFA